MKLSTRTQYGLRMLCQLASQHDRSSMQMSELAEREGISEKYLGQIMLILKSAGLVKSVRGAQGGYYLGACPDQINLLAIFEILEGEILEYESDDGTMADDKGSARPAATEIWSELQRTIAATLAKYSLADVVRLGLYKSGFVDFHI